MMQSELRRQLTAAGMYLEHETWTPMYGPAWSAPEPTDDEAEALMVWLGGWTNGELAAEDLRDYPRTSGWELTRHVWCPRCERAGDPLRQRWTVRLKERRPYCAVFPPPPLLEIGPGCPNSRAHGTPYAGHMWNGGDTPCATRRVFRWGLRREREPSVRQLLEEAFDRATSVRWDRA